MQFALQDGNRILATPGARATCATCGEIVVAKCGSILHWHWSHLSGSECDPWSEGESQWHLNWKSLFPAAWREVVVGPHRADVKTPTHVVELQHSPIDAKTIREREDFYGPMLWIVDALGIWENLTFRKRDNYATFGWKWPRKSWWVAERPICLDTYDGYFLIGKIHKKTPCGGWGTFLSERELLARVGATPEAMRNASIIDFQMPDNLDDEDKLARIKAIVDSL